MFENLSSDNITLYAVKAYDKPNCIMSEFKEDMKRFNYVKRLLYRYREFDELRERLVLNHLVIIYNIFGPEPATRLLFYRIPKQDWPSLKTYLLFLSFMPEVVYGIRNENILSSDITVDLRIAETLRQVK